MYTYGLKHATAGVDFFQPGWKKVMQRQHLRCNLGHLPASQEELYRDIKKEVYAVLDRWKKILCPLVCFLLYMHPLRNEVKMYQCIIDGVMTITVLNTKKTKANLIVS